MLSNYPPGVTGRELEIAGPDWEGEIERTCDKSDVELEFIQPDDIATLKRIAVAKGAQGRGKQRDADIIQRSMARVFSRTIRVALPECPFDGEVDAWRFEGVTHWTCPVCGSDHDEDDRE